MYVPCIKNKQPTFLQHHQRSISQELCFSVPSQLLPSSSLSSMPDQRHKIRQISILASPAGMIPVCKWSRILHRCQNASIPSGSPIHASTTAGWIDQVGITTFPVCGIRGFTDVPGDNEIGVWPPPPVSRHVCVSSCRHNDTCKAVSYAKQYKLCSYYSKYMNEDHLSEDTSSNFEHYDEVCPEGGYWENEDFSVELDDWGSHIAKRQWSIQSAPVVAVVFCDADSRRLMGRWESPNRLLMWWYVWYELKACCANNFLRKAGTWAIRGRVT